MAKLTADQEKMLADLQALAEAPDADDFEVEVYDTGKGRGARIPYSRAAKWLRDELGIGEDPDAGTTADPDEKTGKAGKGGEGGQVREGYFGRQSAGG
jgi:hypothetical protein